MALMRRVEYLIDWGDKTVREVVFETLPKPVGGWMPDEVRGRLSFAVDSMEEADEIVATVERSHRSKTAADKLAGSKDKDKPKAASSRPRKEPDAVVPAANTAAAVPTNGTNGAVAEVVPIDPRQTDLEQHLAEKAKPEAPSLMSLPPVETPRPGKTPSFSGSHPAPPAEEVADLVNYVRKTITRLEQASVKEVIVHLQEGGVKDPGMYVAVCDALRADAPKLAKIANMGDRVDRTLVILGSEAEVAAAKG